MPETSLTDKERISAEPEKLLFTIKDTARMLNMSTKSVRRQIDRGNLRRCTKFGRVLIPRKDVASFVEKFSSFAV